ncbi:MAG: hypothetical protein AAGJ46_01330 [Planctomycetota bacterium]
MKNPRMFTFLRQSAETDKQKALMTLELLSEHPAGIGDHSTEDFYKNAEEALALLCDAEDRLENLDKFFGFVENGSGPSALGQQAAGALPHAPGSVPQATSTAANETAS